MRAIRQQTTTFVKTNGKGHLIQLQTDRKASYDTYLHVQDQLAAAYNAVRDQRASSLFGQPFEQCSREQQTRIADEVPVRISEVYAAAAGKAGKGGGR